MRNKKSVLMTLNHNYGYFSSVGSGIAGNWCFPDFDRLGNIGGKAGLAALKSKHGTRNL